MAPRSKGQTPPHGELLAKTTVMEAAYAPEETCSSVPNQRAATPSFRRSRLRPYESLRRKIPHGLIVREAPTGIRRYWLQKPGTKVDNGGVSDRTDAVAPDTKRGTASSLWHQASRSQRAKAVATAIVVALAFLAGGIYCLVSNDRGDGVFILALAPFMGIGFFFEGLGYRHWVSGTSDTQTSNLWRSTEGGYWQDSRTQK